MTCDRWVVSLGTPISPTIKTDRHDIVESDVKHHKTNVSGPVVVVIVWYLDIQLRVQSVSMARCTRYNITVCQCMWFPPVSSTNKTYRHNITEILLKVALKAQP